MEPTEPSGQHKKAEVEKWWTTSGEIAQRSEQSHHVASDAVTRVCAGRPAESRGCKSLTVKA